MTTSSASGPTSSSTSSTSRTSYGVVELDGDRVVSFREKPDDPESTLVSIACYAFPASALDLIGEYLADDNNPDEPGWFIQWLQNRGTVRAFDFDGAWFDIGTAESYLETVAWTLDGGTMVDDDAIVRDSDLGRSVQILGGAEVRNTTLRDSVVFPGATIVDCDLRDSIVDEEAHVEGLDRSGALVGAHTQLPGRE